MRLDGVYYVFLFHTCQADNGADYAKFAADFIEIQHFMLLLRGLRGVGIYQHTWMFAFGVYLSDMVAA